MKFVNWRVGELVSFTVALLLATMTAAAQSPNTSTIVVLVTDQSGAVVTDAKVSVTNNQTGAVRDSASGSDGSATFPALSLTGTYTVAVTKQGFGDERQDVTLRGGETATLKVKLLVGTETAAVTVYGTTAGVRADPQIARRMDSPLIDETPILGRKVSTLPLFNSGRGKARAISSSTRRTSSRAAAAGARPPSCSMAPATTKAGAGRP